MLAALLTSLLWAISAVSAQRAALALGSLKANSVRLIIALLALGMITACVYPDSFSRPTFFWLFLSGVIGFGLGDVALYLALARVGSRLTVLITFCFAPILAAFGEWLWLGDLITLRQAGCAILIVAGVCLALKPTSSSAERYGSVAVGLLMAFGAAAGQGFGAVLTRVANQSALELGFEVPALSQAFQRVLGGCLISLPAHLLTRLQKAPGPSVPEPSSRRNAWLWILVTALSGPVIGLMFYQIALQSTHSAIVLAIVSFTPIAVLPLAYHLEGDRPASKALLGACFAILGMIFLALSSP